MDPTTYLILSLLPFIGLSILGLLLFCTWLGDWLNPHEPPDMGPRAPWLWGWE